MLRADQIEELIQLITAMDRATLIQQFQAYPARFPIDFTQEFLDRQPLDRLRHIFMALCLQNQRMPALSADAA